jgi:hypothetical protein
MKTSCGWGQAESQVARSAFNSNNPQFALQTAFDKCVGLISPTEDHAERDRRIRLT